MKTYKNQNRVFGVVILLTILLSLLFPTSSVFADDTTPPADTTEVVDTPAGDETPPEEDEVASEGETPTEEPATEETVTEESAAEETATEEPAAEQPAPEEEAQTNKESVLAQVPDGTDVVVLDEGGDVVPLVTQEAADAIASSDPMWCPDGVDPVANTNGCTGSYSSMTALLAALSGGGQPNQAGTIWIEKTYNSSTAEPGGTTVITIDGDWYPTWQGHSLTIQGGWNGPGTNTIDSSTPSLFSGDRLRIVDWQNNVTVRNILFDGGSGDASLLIEIDTPATNAYNVTLENVEARNNVDQRGAFIDNDESTGSVTVNNSKFINNGDTVTDKGLEINAMGNVTLQNVIATGNRGVGVQVNNTFSDTAATVQVLGTNVFNGNLADGLLIRSDGNITLNNIIADGNINGDGVDISNTTSSTNATITFTGTNSFRGNTLNGLYARSTGAITLTNITANNSVNANGVVLDNRSVANAGVTLTGTNNFNGNNTAGLSILSNGAVSLANITANGNKTSRGVSIDNCNYSGVACLGSGNVTLTGTLIFTNNGDNDDGLYINSGGNVAIENVTATGNGDEGVQIDNLYSTSNASVQIGGTNVFTGNMSYGLYVRSKGAITASNVTANGSKTTGGAYLDNDEPDAIGDVTITGTSSFSGNPLTGLDILSRGAVNLNNITVNNNIGLYGLNIYNVDSSTSGGVTITGTNSFSGNGNTDHDTGLTITSKGNITLNNITANGNNAIGGIIDNTASTSEATVTISGINSFSNNLLGNGLHLYSNGNVTLENITADHNLYRGIDIYNDTSSNNATVTMNGTNSVSNNRGDDGLVIRSDGTIRLNNITADSNGHGINDNGAELYNQTGNGDIIITGYYNSFSNNPGPGLDIRTKGNIEMYFVTISGNNTASGSLDGAVLNSWGVNSKTANFYCNTFGNNKGYGLNAWNYRGALTFNGLNSFAGNPSGDYLYNGTAGSANYDCTIPGEILGCTDPTALNYDPSATIDDGSCIPVILGCTDPTAFNYNPTANTDDGSCVPVILGCTDESAPNYNPLANTDDGSCAILGCTDPTALNYNPSATIDDGSCIILGCTDPTAFNYNSSAVIDDGSCKMASLGGSDANRNLSTAFIPVTGGQLVSISCSNPLTILQLLNGDFVTFANLCGYEAMLDVVSEDGLPGTLLNGVQYVSDLEVTLIHDGNAIDNLPEGTSMSVSFIIPTEMEGENFTILRWVGSSYVEESVSFANGYVTVTVSKPGTFVLVVK